MKNKCLACCGRSSTAVLALALSVGCAAVVRGGLLANSPRQSAHDGVRCDAWVAGRVAVDAEGLSAEEFHAFLQGLSTPRAREHFPGKVIAARSSLLPPLRNSRNHVAAQNDNSALRPTPSRRVSRSAHAPAFLQIRAYHDMTKIRGGSSEKEEEKEYDEGKESSDEVYDTDSEMDETDDSDIEEEYDSDEQEEDYEDKAVTTQSSLKSSILSKSRGSSDSNSDEIVEYDDLLVAPAMQQFGVTIGVMMLANRIDIFRDAKAVQIARYVFLGYIISVQVFLLYVRFRAKSINNRTPVTISNPLASLFLNGASSKSAAGGGGNFMVKALADQFLSTQTTILEYDLKEAKKMNGGLLFPMIFLYFLHFKMKQVQPLLMQTATGMLNVVYSPLFQVYVMGKNLERPFKPLGQQGGAGQQDNVAGEEERGEGRVSAEDDEDEESKDTRQGGTSESSEEQEVSDEQDVSEYDDSDE